MNLDEFIRQNRLPDVFSESAKRFYLPYAEWLNARITEKNGTTLVLGINGGQGTGKSTLSQLISEYLASEHERKVVILSIDDIYLTKDERNTLGQSVHPLLRTRGVPGTHDISLGLSVIEKLRSLKAGETASFPAFDKSRDDRHPQSNWNTVTGPVDLLIFEGWCVASRPTTSAELEEPLNKLESTQDADGQWRTYVNEKLGTDYAELFAALDSLLFLQVPGLDAVYRWRLEQEHKLRQSSPRGASGIMSDEEVAEFIQLYERITRDNLAVLPSVSDAVIELGDDHQPTLLRFADNP